MTADYDTLIPCSPLPETLQSVPPLPAFDSTSLAFVDALSKRLLRMPEARVYPELTSLGFWMRQANIERLRSNMDERAASALLVPRGTVLHFAPSNVDTIFIYSWFISLLTGNRNVIRLSSRFSPQADLLVHEIKALLENPLYMEIARRTLLVRYPADDRVTARLSSICDVRVIWGGDSTVEHIRKLPIPPTATEVAFANKYSLALVGAQNWLDEDEIQKQKLIESFYNDAYWFDQMACSSPRLMLWLGEQVQAEVAAVDFWERIERHLAYKRPNFDDTNYVNKLVAADSMAIEADICIRKTVNNDLVRVWLNEPSLHNDFHCGAGLFFESVVPSLDAIRPLLNRTVQTLSYACIDKYDLLKFATSSPLAGIDRIVPFGHALDFEPVWDGFDLFRVFMREITVS